LLSNGDKWERQIAKNIMHEHLYRWVTTDLSIVQLLKRFSILF
jgi:hypothetical protein